MVGKHFEGFVNLIVIHEVKNIFILYKTEGNTYEENVSLRNENLDSVQDRRQYVRRECVVENLVPEDERITGKLHEIGTC